MMWVHEVAREVWGSLPFSGSGRALGGAGGGARRSGLVMALSLLTGCWDFAPRPDPDKPPGRLPNPVLAENQAWVAPDPEQAKRFSGGEDGVEILVRTTGIGGDYRGYLMESDRIEALSRALAPCLNGPVELVLSFVSSTGDGRMVLVVPRGRLTCAAARTEDGAVDVSPLLPLTRGMASYRLGLGQTRDLRLLSWRVGVLVDDAGGRGVTMWLGGTPPEDGSAVSPCVDVDGRTHCPEGADRRAGVTALNPEDRSVRRSLARHLGAPTR